MIPAPLWAELLEIKTACLSLKYFASLSLIYKFINHNEMQYVRDMRSHAVHVFCIENIVVAFKFDTDLKPKYNLLTKTQLLCLYADTTLAESKLNQENFIATPICMESKDSSLV